SQVPRTLTLKVCSQSSSLSDSAVPATSTPALLTTVVTLPKCWTVMRTASSTCLEMLTSLTMARQAGPICSATASSFLRPRAPLLAVAPADCAPGAFPGEGYSDGAPDAAPASADDGDFIGQTHGRHCKRHFSMIPYQSHLVTQPCHPERSASRKFVPRQNHW